MTTFRGVMQGNKGEASRLGTEKSGLGAHLCGWNGGVNVQLYHDNLGRDSAKITLTGGSNGYGERVTLYDGPIDLDSRKAIKEISVVALNSDTDLNISELITKVVMDKKKDQTGDNSTNEH